MRTSRLGAALLFAALGVAGCSRPAVQAVPGPAPQAKDSPAGGAARTGAAPFALSSPAFADGQPIPKRYSADGDGISPPLRWSHPPAGTKAFALVVRDPDAPGGVFVHWVLYALPPALQEIAERVPAAETVSSLGNARQGVNSTGRPGYTPPSPPPGKLHHYIFTLYALDERMSLAPRATDKDLAEAIAGRVTGQAAVTGTYQR